MAELNNRIDFVYIIDVQDGNPNGDPDAGNLPRIDAETGMGIITDVCLKRKVRNYVQISRNCEDGFDIFIKEKAILNNLIDAAHEDESVKSITKAADKTEAARHVMCKKYYDIRSFGAVMSTGKNAGQVRGPIQFTFARSIDPIFPMDNCITRVAVTKEDDADKQNGENRAIGRKYTVPYGLYVCHGFITPNFAAATGFNEEDLQLFWEALENMFECDHSAARGLMSARKLFVFRHPNRLGNAPAYSLFDRIKITRKNPQSPARAFSDYEITVDREGLADKNIELLELI
jgi:CRISPR-associated protein Csd2